MTDERADTRAERLKAALRENLRRRKAQGRGRAEAGREAAEPRAGAPSRRGPDSDKTGL